MLGPGSLISPSARGAEGASSDLSQACVKVPMASDDPELPITSSREPLWIAEARDCYQDALRVLLDSGIGFVVGGAFAIHAHTGIWRTTKDLDIFLPPQDAPAAMEQLRGCGFDTWVKDPVWLAKASRGDFFIDLITGIGNASMQVDASWIERAPPETVLSVRCKVLAPEECIASRIFVAYRERFDGAEVVHLLRACGRQLDWDRIMHLTGAHWEMLYWLLVLYAYVYPAHTDMIPAAIWDDLIHRFTERVKRPNKQAPFRGSLIDPRMFAIDVNEWGERNLYEEYIEKHPAILRTEDSHGSEK